MYEQAGEGQDFDVIECADFGLGFIPWVINRHKPVITRFHGSSGQIHLHEPKEQGDFNMIYLNRQNYYYYLWRISW